MLLVKQSVVTSPLKTKLQHSDDDRRDSENYFDDPDDDTDGRCCMFVVRLVASDARQDSRRGGTGDRGDARANSDWTAGLYNKEECQH